MQLQPPIQSVLKASPMGREIQLRQLAEKLEASFLAEMLKSAGLGKQAITFGGGVGEEQFASFLVQAQADEMAKVGGIGLAESLFQALKGQENEK